MNTQFKKAFILRILNIVMSFLLIAIAIILFFVWITSTSYVSGKSSSNKVALAFAIVSIVIALTLAIVGACFEKKYKRLRDENDQQFVRNKVFELNTKLKTLESEISRNSYNYDLVEQRKALVNQIHYYQHNYLADLAAKRVKRAAILTVVIAATAAAASSAAEGFERGYRNGRDSVKRSKI